MRKLCWTKAKNKTIPEKKFWLRTWLCQATCPLGSMTNERCLGNEATTGAYRPPPHFENPLPPNISALWPRAIYWPQGAVEAIVANLHMKFREFLKQQTRTAGIRPFAKISVKILPCCLRLFKHVRWVAKRSIIVVLEWFCSLVSRLDRKKFVTTRKLRMDSSWDFFAGKSESEAEHAAAKGTWEEIAAP